MTAIRINGFRGAVPSAAPKLLNDNQARRAVNCDLSRGDLRPWDGLAVPDTADTDLDKAAGNYVEAIYLFRGDYWLHWHYAAHAARGPIADNTEERTYFTVEDGTPPQVTDATMATSGSDGEYPRQSRPVGVPAPHSAPSASPNGSCDAANRRTTVYVYTFVNDWDEEGPPSPPSSAVDRCVDGSVQLKGLDDDADSYGSVVDARYSHNVITKRIYRAVTGSKGTDYQWVMDISASDSSVEDDRPDSELGEKLPSRRWYPPPEEMTGLIMLPNGIAAGKVGQDLYLSEQYLPHAWPEAYRHTLEYEIVGLGVIGQSIVACTRGTPYIVQGTAPGSYTAKKVPASQACVSAKSIVSVEGAVIYASPDGLVQVNSQGAQVITSGILNRDDWQALSPASIVAGYHDRRYFGFYDNGSERGGFVIDPRDPESGFTWLRLDGRKVMATHADLETDTLYLALETPDPDRAIRAWGRGDPMSARWVSKRFVAPQETSFAAMQIVAQAYNDVEVTLWADGEEHFGVRLNESSTPGMVDARFDLKDGTGFGDTKTIPRDEAFRLPAKGRRREWQIQIDTKSAVQEVVLASSMTEVASG